MAIKKGDTVIVRAGKDRGTKAKVLRALPAEGTVLVEGVNMVKKHQRKRKEGEKGQMVTRPMPIKVSSVSLWCSKCGKGVRLGSKMAGDKKLRVCVTCGTEL